jgi:hypothetical protein
MWNVTHYSPNEGQRFGSNSNFRNRKQIEAGKNLKIKTLDHNSHSSIVMISEETGRYIVHCGVQSLVERLESIFITLKRIFKK